MAKYETGQVKGQANYAPFDSAEDFYQWVATNHGTDVRAACEAGVQKIISTGQDAQADSVLRGLLQLTRNIDLSKLQIRARFVY